MGANEIVIDARILRYYRMAVITEAEMWELRVYNWLT